MDEKFIKLWKNLYANLTTSQINKALRDAGLSHEDWMAFLKHMKGETDR